MGVFGHEKNVICSGIEWTNRKSNRSIGCDLLCVRAVWKTPFFSLVLVIRSSKPAAISSLPEFYMQNNKLHTWGMWCVYYIYVLLNWIREKGEKESHEEWNGKSNALSVSNVEIVDSYLLWHIFIEYRDNIIACLSTTIFTIFVLFKFVFVIDGYAAVECVRKCL